jgi:DNA-binding MarR family transcriptional regulator
MEKNKISNDLNAACNHFRALVELCESDGAFKRYTTLGQVFAGILKRQIPEELAIIVSILFEFRTRKGSQPSSKVESVVDGVVFGFYEIAVKIYSHALQMSQGTHWDNFFRSKQTLALIKSLNSKNCTNKSLSEDLGVTPGRISQIISDLERCGAVVFEKQGLFKLIKLTETGQALLEALEEGAMQDNKRESGAAVVSVPNALPSNSSELASGSTAKSGRIGSVDSGRKPTSESKALKGDAVFLFDNIEKIRKDVALAGTDGQKNWCNDKDEESVRSFWQNESICG